jgi:assimilatory nitrate reductase catalytic subunit
MPSSQAPQGFKSRGKIVCNCFNVSESEIGDALTGMAGDADARLAGLQEKLKCGTNCGSCVPELKKIILVQQTSMKAAA